MINDREILYRTSNFSEDLSKWNADYMVNEQENLYKNLLKK